MDDTFINEKLVGIFKKSTGIDFDVSNQEMINEKLLGSKINLEAVTLVYVLFDVEEEFGIIIPEKDITDGRFDSFYNIQCIIKDSLLYKVN